MTIQLKFLIAFLIIPLYSFSQQVTTYTYVVKQNDSLKLDVYTPVNSLENEKKPVLIWMHGGGFSGGYRDGNDEKKFMNYLTNKGYVGVSISYRLLRQGSKTGFGCDCSKREKLFTFAQAAEDFLDATNFIISMSDSLHVDVNKIIAGGSSAGAEAVLSAVYMKDYFIEDTTAYDHIKYAGLVSFAGAMVDESYITSETAIPTVLFHGTKDNLVPYSKNPHHFCKPEDKGFLMLNGAGVIFTRLEQLNASYYLFRVEGGRHEVAAIPFHELDHIMNFLNLTVIKSKVIQTKRLEFKP
ncbi:alpha/beta hydrolase [Psychroserpens sp. SPM9]|uniref:alpha/beta hydrolase n=1 Tax=Psychroserpens sp. SPM9 TaxID=2975598 RepID=UPI0021A57F8F|nr:alpha/beta hydrolase [Psychroserpens sp. SPM9]MDG5491336.1 alpha/beta hydrolase [Psychroserpens sp. SPM9]